MKAKVFKREKERLYLDDKSLVTSKRLLQHVGAKIPDARPDEDQTDLQLLGEDERFVDEEVKQLQKIGAAM